MRVLPYKSCIEFHKDIGYPQMRALIPFYSAKDGVTKSIIAQISKQVVNQGIDAGEISTRSKSPEVVKGWRDTPEVVNPSGPKDQPVTNSRVSN